MNEEEKLGENEVSAIVAFLSSNVAEFKTLGEYHKVLRKLIEASDEIGPGDFRLQRPAEGRLAGARGAVDQNDVGPARAGRCRHGRAQTRATAGR